MLDCIEQRFVVVEEPDKLSRLKDMLLCEVEDDVKVMVFTNSVEAVDMVAESLNEAGFVAVSLHYLMSCRLHLLEFRTKRCNVLVATDDLAGHKLDVPNVDHVIYYEMLPRQEPLQARLQPCHTHCMSTST